MPSEQPQYFTLIDLLSEVANVTVISTGCYVGWNVGGNFLALLFGGLLGRVVGITVYLGLQRLVRPRP
jgi:hypothetical protein